MQRRRKSDPEKEQPWRDYILEQTKSNLSVNRFCQLHQINASTFHSWRKIIRQRDASRNGEIDGNSSETSVGSSQPPQPRKIDRSNSPPSCMANPSLQPTTPSSESSGITDSSANVTNTGSASEAPTFIPIELLSSASPTDPFELVLPNGCTLRIPPQFDVNALTHILGMLV